MVFCGTGWLSVVDRIAERLPSHARIRVRDPQQPVAEIIEDAAVLLPSNARIGPDELAAAKALRLIQQPAAGYDGIDLAAARARGIPVCNAPGANHGAVAEAALFLMLALARRYQEARRSLALGVIGEPVGRELQGRTLGIIGRGNSGSRLSSLASALGMQVRSVNSKSTRDELRGMLSTADFVSIHCPLSPATTSLFNDETFAWMKEGAALINCARGPIIDRPALERALDSGRLGAVGIDTLWSEPWDPSDPLFEHPKIMVLPHVAGSTEEAFARIADTVAENIRRLSDGRALLHRIA